MTMYDIAQLAQLRKDADFNAVDFTRGSIEPTADGGFAVKLKAPLVPINDLLDPPPTLSFVTGSALLAEAWMLDNLIKIARAERLKIRTGRVSSWSTVQITRTPLSDAEVAEYKAFLEHRNKVAKLQAELSEAMQKKAARQSAQAGAAALQARYGNAPAQAVPVVEVAQESTPAAPEATPDVSIETLLAQSAAPIYATRKTSKRK
ncbi:hypothetical protein E8F11_22860 [Pseudomonas sp. BN417]|uniref:hypothetical protein n=1 Tax=Pseudomonas sp. BN417 TaxID=2567890 RepID=UPI0024538D4D|nr:hypothetical protein [Pseudomonas sp. BN417]MDH4557980.1 hypothetical protein [Pseudomonas sp. BN417]